MNHFFEQIFTHNPDREENRILYFNADDDGDYFTENDINDWRTIWFQKNWNERKLLENKASNHLISSIIEAGSPVIELACGPGMGLIPSIKQINPSFPCMATDANSLVVSEWKQYLDDKEKYDSLDFAQFSILDMPIKSGTVQAYSSFIGISSTRSGNSGYRLALSEIYRTLASGGLLYTIENEWSDVPAILGLFEKMNRQPWNCFNEEQISWHDRFIESDFEIVYEKQYEYRSLRADDNELGKAALEFGVDIGMNFTAYIVKKKNALNFITGITDKINQNINIFMY